MHSLRSRLTLSYTILLATLLIAVMLVVTRLALNYFVRPLAQNAAAATALADTIVAEHPRADARTISRLIVQNVKRPGIDVFSLHKDRRGPPHPHEHGLVNLVFPHGLEPHVIRVGSDLIFIAADVRLLQAAVGAYLKAIAICMIIAIVLAWLVARWITAQAMRPLVAVTRELERFGRGDFTPRPVSASRSDELGALGMAYNGAAAQVASAFAERVRVEEHMRRFVAEAGHELRTPLTVIGGYLDILKRADPADVRVRERAHQTLALENRRMRALVERLTTLAKLEHPQTARVTAVDAVRAAEDAIAAVERARGGSIELRARGEADVLADPAELQEALGNLIDNAVKYGADSPVVVDIEPAAERVVVRVRDGGPGIPQHERHHVFERFFRGDGRGAIEGSGLGLAIVERAAERCGGSVTLESADPGNTVFALSLRGLSAS